MAESPRDYYEVLGVSRDADTKTIKDAFRRLARRYHPDTSAEPGAVERFKEIAEAYGVLSDPARRADYDAGPLTGRDGATPEDVWANIDFGDVFGSGGPGISVGLFEQIFGRPFVSGPRQGGDLTVAVTIPLQQVMTGGEQDITLPRPGPCRETITIGIAAGVPEGTVLLLPGRGLPSPAADGPPGDAYVIVRTQSDPRWARAEADLWQNLHISVADAALGTTTRILALAGDVKVRIAPGTQTGTIVRIPGEGLPRYRQPGRGSLNITVTVDIPQRMTPGQRQLYEQLRAEEATAGAGAASPPDSHHPVREWIRRHHAG